MFAPHYLEQTFIIPVVQRGTGEDIRYLPDLPETKNGFGLVLCFVGGINYYAYPLPASTLGKQCLCHVVYHAEDDGVMKDKKLKLGKGNEVTKIKEYKDIVKKTVGQKYIEDEKVRLTQEAEAKGETVDQATLDAVTCDLPEKDDGVPLWVFQTKGYVDK